MVYSILKKSAIFEWSLVKKMWRYKLEPSTLPKSTSEPTYVYTASKELMLDFLIEHSLLPRESRIKRVESHTYGNMTVTLCIIDCPVENNIP